jgi:hypothetical protein
LGAPEVTYSSAAIANRNVGAAFDSRLVERSFHVMDVDPSEQLVRPRWNRNGKQNGPQDQQQFQPVSPDFFRNLWRPMFRFEKRCINRQLATAGPIEAARKD